MLKWNMQWPVLLSTVRLEQDNTQGIAGSLVCGHKKEKSQLGFHEVLTAETVMDSRFSSNLYKIEI